jgi:hypothetical protein
MTIYAARTYALMRVISSKSDLGYVAGASIAEATESPSTFSLTDPKEREPLDYPYLHSWVGSHIGRLLRSFEESVKREALIPAEAHLGFVPSGYR